MNRFGKMDEQLSSALERLPNILASVKWTSVGSLGDAAAIAKLGFPGIYLIEVRTSRKHSGIKEWVDAMRLEWGKKEHEGMFIPTPKKKRFDRHVELKEWMPLYMGKSKNVGKRVREHIDLPLEKRTFALKIKARGYRDLKRYRLRVIELKVKNYDVIAPAVERGLRDLINPVIGRQ